MRLSQRIELARNWPDELPGDFDETVLEAYCIMFLLAHVTMHAEFEVYAAIH